MKLRSFGVLSLQVLLCLVSAGMLFSAYPYLNQHYLAWFAFVPWLTAIENAPRRRAVLLSYFTGILFWGAAVYWLVHVTLIGLIGLVLYLSLYFAAFGFIVSTTRRQVSLVKVLFVPSVWVLLEFLRSHLLTGFPWALVAYTQSSWLQVIQPADLTGAWGISFLILAVNVAVKGAVVRLSAGKHPFVPGVIFSGFLLAASLGYGNARLAQPPRSEETRCRIAVIQGNVPHEQKWQPATRDAVMETHLTLTRAAAADADLIVWSEAALPVILEDEPGYFEQVRAAIRESGIPLLMGAITHRDVGFFNSAMLLMPSGEISGVYDKMHLVPFGEYIPLRAVFTFLETLAPIGELSRGREYTVFRCAGSRMAKEVRFSTLICFEDLFPEMARKFVDRGAVFLVNVTNDAWYRFSPATYQHCQAAVFRAVENRVPVIRCANTGVSCFIDRNGRITKTIKDESGRQLFVSGYAEDEVVAGAPARSLYNRYGDYFIGVCWFFVFMGAVLYFFEKL